MFPNKSFFNVKSHLEKNDHPELDNTKLCNEEQITKYMCIIGQLQWAITLGRYDILAHIRAVLIKDILWRLPSKISHKFLTWHDVSSKWKYLFLLKSHIVSIISHNLLYHPDEINENIFLSVNTSSCFLIIIVLVDYHCISIPFSSCL